MTNWYWIWLFQRQDCLNTEAVPTLLGTLSSYPSRISRPQPTLSINTNITIIFLFTRRFREFFRSSSRTWYITNQLLGSSSSNEPRWYPSFEIQVPSSNFTVALSESPLCVHLVILSVLLHALLYTSHSLSQCVCVFPFYGGATP